MKDGESARKKANEKVGMKAENRAVKKVEMMA